MNAFHSSCLLFATLAVGSASAQPKLPKTLTPAEEIENLENNQEILESENKSLKAEIIAKVARLHDMASARYDEGNYREAQDKIALAYEAFEVSGSEDNQARLRHLRLLCNAANALGENDMTIHYAIEVAIHAESSEDRAIACNSLGLAYGAKGDLEKAIKYHEKSLAIRVKAFGPKHPGVAVTYNNLGNAYRNMGEHDKAIEHYQKSQEIYAKEFDLEHPNVAITYNNLGETYRAKEEYDTAIGYYQKSLAIKSKMLGSKHPSIAITSTNLANTYLSLGVDFAEGKDVTNALENMFKAQTAYLTIDQEHPHLADVYLSIGSVYLENEDKQLALENLLKAKDFYLRTRPADDPGAQQAQSLIDEIN